MARIALLVLLLIGAAGAIADACPPGPCNKYRRPPMPDVITPRVTGYVRQVPGRLPRLTRAHIAAFLAGSTWDPIFPLVGGVGRDVEVIAPPRVRFVDARNVTRAARPQTRTVLLRRIAVRSGTAMVEVDGNVFVLERCADARTRACLTLRDDLSFEEPVVEQTEFAKPPAN